MTNQLVSLQIDPKTIEGIVNAHVETAVAAALDKEGKLVNDLIRGICNSMVDSDGRPCRDSYGAKYNLIEYSLRKQVQGAVEAAVKKWLVNHEADMLKEVELALSRSQSAIAQAFVSVMTGTEEQHKQNPWQLKVNFAVANNTY